MPPFAPRQLAGENDKPHKIGAPKKYIPPGAQLAEPSKAAAKIKKKREKKKAAASAATSGDGDGGGEEGEEGGEEQGGGGATGPADGSGGGVESVSQRMAKVSVNGGPTQGELLKGWAS